MNTKEAKRVKLINWTETLRRMSVGSFFTCSIEEKDLIAPKAYSSKDGKYTINKIEGTSNFKVTRVK